MPAASERIIYHTCVLQASKKQEPCKATGRTVYGAVERQIPSCFEPVFNSVATP